jgi:5'-3' exonuclease
MFVTTKFNFRDQLVDDYKANRKDVERPVNLAWAKKWSTENLNTHYHKGLEADDLLGIYMDDDTVLWSLDKDLLQISGKHLDDDTMKVKEVTYEGELEDRGKKVYFTGMVGFYYQCLVGDSTDNIVGCGKRVPATYKSGAKAGQNYIKRQGIGSKAALKLLQNAEDPLSVVINCYKELHGEDWQEQLETQANLLWMVREHDYNHIKRWTYDGRDEWFDLVEGVILYG